MNDQEKVYKVIQAAVKKLQEKGIDINEEQFVQLIQDTYKKAATKEEGDKAVKDMFAEIFKDEKKMFKDGGKMESAVNKFKCGGRSKSKSSKKVRKGQEGLEFYGQNFMNQPGWGFFSSSAPNQEILYKHHPGPHTPLIGFREKHGKYIWEPMSYEGVLKDGTRISAWGSHDQVERFKTAKGNIEEEFWVPTGRSKTNLNDSLYSRRIVDPKTGSEWEESAWIAEDGKWRVRRWDPEYRRNVTPEEFKETIKRFREGWKNIESQNPAIIRITKNDD